MMLCLLLCKPKFVSESFFNIRETKVCLIRKLMAMLSLFVATLLYEMNI